MNTTSDEEVQKWMERNIGISLDQLSAEDAGIWLKLAEDETWTFFRLAEEGLRLRRKKAHQPPPTSLKEVVTFLLEFRLKIRLVHDQFKNLPKVPVFDFGGKAFLKSPAYLQSRMLYSNIGGAV